LFYIGSSEALLIRALRHEVPIRYGSVFRIAISVRPSGGFCSIASHEIAWYTYLCEDILERGVRMQKRNVTLSMPTDLIRRAKALAAARDKSLSELLRESLEEKVSEAAGYRQAMERQLRLLATGFDLGLRGKVSWSRDSVHERG